MVKMLSGLTVGEFLSACRHGEHAPVEAPAKMLHLLQRMVSPDVHERPDCQQIVADLSQLQGELNNGLF